MKIQGFKRTKLACYSAYFTMSSIFSLPPLLFATLQDRYDISYTLLGTLVLTNFCTQLGIDLVFTFFSSKFNPKKIVKTMPLITSLGLIIYALIPTLFPNIAYLGLLIGTIIFSVSAGLSEVLLSPMIAAIPSDDPKRDMSTLHSLYAFGVFTVVVISSLFLKLFGTDRWMILTLFFGLLPIIPAVLFSISPMPDMNPSVHTKETRSHEKHTIALALCVGCIFFGSCAENAMSNWISSYAENALGISKTLGDILGMAMFAILLGLARIIHAKYGKSIFRTLTVGMIGALVCYLTVGFTSNATVALVACILTGLFTSMLWPGSLIMMEENLPGVGVAAFALMASGGDLGAAIAPQLLGIIVDTVSASTVATELSTSLGLTTEQIGLRVGMLSISVFPLIGIFVVLLTRRYFKRHK